MKIPQGEVLFAKRLVRGPETCELSVGSTDAATGEEGDSVGEEPQDLTPPRSSSAGSPTPIPTPSHLGKLRHSRGVPCGARDPTLGGALPAGQLSSEPSSMSLSVNRNLSGSAEPSADGHGSTPRTPPLSSSLLGIRNGEAAGCKLKLERGPPPPHAGWPLSSTPCQGPTEWGGGCGRPKGGWEEAPGGGLQEI